MKKTKLTLISVISVGVSNAATLTLEFNQSDITVTGDTPGGSTTIAYNATISGSGTTTTNTGVIQIDDGLGFTASAGFSFVGTTPTSFGPSSGGTVVVAPNFGGFHIANNGIGIPTNGESNGRLRISNGETFRFDVPSGAGYTAEITTFTTEIPTAIDVTIDSSGNFLDALANTNNGSRFSSVTIDFQQVPEPSSTALIGLGCLALVCRRRK